MTMHVYDFRWNSETSFEFQATDGQRFARKKMTLGDSLSVEITKEVQCAGSMRDGEWQRCPDNISGKRKCEICRNREGNFIITSFDGFNTQNFTDGDLEKMRGEHVVYLAIFGENLYKIGVSRLERKALRQVEQGAHATLYIAQTPDGTTARQIETLFRRTGLADKIRASSKKDFLTPEFSKTPESILLSAYTKGKENLEAYQNLKKFLLPEPEFKDWSKTYGLMNTKQTDKSFHTIKLESGESISGKIITAKGPFLVIETDSDLISICTKDLLGYWIDFSNRPVGIELKNALQGALF